MASLKYFLLSPFVFLCLSCTLANRVPNSDDGSDFDVGAWPGAGPTAGPGVKGVSNVRAGPRAGPKAGPGAEGWVSNVRAGPKAGPRAGSGAEKGVGNVWAGPKAGPGAEEGVSNAKSGPTVGPSAEAGTEGGVSSSEAGARRDVDPIISGLGVGVDIGYRSGFGTGLGGYWSGPGTGGGELYNGCTLGYVCPAYGRRGCNKFSYGNCETYGFHPLTASMDLHEVEIKWAKGSKPAAMPQNGV